MENEKWTRQELAEAAKQLWVSFKSERMGDGELFIEDVIATRDGWGVGLELRAAIEMACQRNAMRDALVAIEAHHIELNRKAHRKESASFTLAICRTGLEKCK